MSSQPSVRIVSVDEVPWADVERVFGTRGDPSSCWCQYFKMENAEWKKASVTRCAPLLREQIRRGPPPGVVAYLDDEPIGWCAVEPRDNYSHLHRTRASTASREPQGDPSVWAVTCFVVRVGYRRRGIGRALMQGAVDQARRLGARVIEGYPVDVAARGKTTSADLYHGTASLFAAAGFAETARPSHDRPVMSLEL